MWRYLLCLSSFLPVAAVDQQSLVSPTGVAFWLKTPEALLEWLCTLCGSFWSCFPRRLVVHRRSFCRLQPISSPAGLRSSAVGAQTAAERIRARTRNLRAHLKSAPPADSTSSPLVRALASLFALCNLCLDVENGVLFGCRWNSVCLFLSALWFIKVSHGLGFTSPSPQRQR